MKDHILEVEKLTKLFYPAISFGDLARLNFQKSPPTKALDSVSFSVSRGKILGVLGPNGAGKTTLLKIISTLILPDKGKVSVNNYRVGNDDEKIKSLIGLVSTEARSFYWRLSGWQNLQFYGSLYGLNKDLIQSKIKQFASIFDLTYQHKRLDSYSTGMKRVFSLIRALLHDPELILFDEPTKSLDYNSVSQLRKFIKDLTSRAKTVILATHNMQEAEELCDLFLILHKGKCFGLGTLDELRKKINSTSANIAEIYLKVTQDA